MTTKTKTKIIIVVVVVVILATLLITLPDWQKPASVTTAANPATTKAAPAVYAAKPETTPKTPIADSQRIAMPTTPPAPAPAATSVASDNPPVASLSPSQTKAIQNNLRHLVSNGNSYMFEKGLTRVTYYDLVGTGTDKYIQKEIPPVVGEDYKDFIIYDGQTQFSITTPDGTEVIITN
jgi:hypothetical protein